MRRTLLVARRRRAGYAPLPHGNARATMGGLFASRHGGPSSWSRTYGEGHPRFLSGPPFISNSLVAPLSSVYGSGQRQHDWPALPRKTHEIASQGRTVTTTTTTEDGTSGGGDDHNDHNNHNDGGDESDRVRYHEPLTGKQNTLLEYTQSLLPTAAACPVGTLSYAQLVQISSGIDQWIASGEHRYLGAEQAELLLKRLIVERGGGRSRPAAGGDGVTEELYERMNLQGSDGRPATWRRNEDVTWHMYNFPPIVHYLNALYSGVEFVNRILSIVALFEEEYADDDSDSYDPYARPLEVRYKYIITCLCDCRTPHAAAAAEHVLHRFESRLRADPDCHANPPTVETYNNVLSCWTKARCARYPPGLGPPGYFHRPDPCANLLCHMLELHRADPVEMARLKPDFLSFNAAIASLAAEQTDLSWRRGDDGGDRHHRTIGRQCHAHLASMLALYEGGDPRCAPDLITFSTVLNALGRGRDEGDAGRAREVLDAMLRLSGALDGDGDGAGDDDDDVAFEYDVVPRNKHFNVVLALMAHARQRHDREALRRAERYVGVMARLGARERGAAAPRELPQTHNEPPAEGRHVDLLAPDAGPALSMRSSAPDVITYNTLLNIAGRAGLPREAERILEGMIRRAHAGEAGAVKPDTISFNTVLMAWSKSRSVEGKMKTEQILHRMQEMADNGDTSVRPDRTSLTTVISALTASAGHNRDAVGQCERIIQRMETSKEPDMRPDVVTYTSLIKCWIESGYTRAGARAEEIVTFLHQRYEEGHAECKPDAMVYNVAINALAKSGAPDSGERAEALLNRMLDHYYAGDANLTPNTRSFSTAIHAWARSGHPSGAARAEKLLRAMHDLEESGAGHISPNTIAYSACILAWRNSTRSDAGKHAEALLQNMEDCEERGVTNLKPNAITYTNVMEAWINSRQHNSLEKVEAILERMIQRGDYKSAPTTVTFNVVMKAIQHSLHPMKHKKAEDLLNRMKKMQEDGGNVKPDIKTYNTFFSACARAEGDAQTRMSAFSLVLNALIEIEGSNHLRPDNYTWPAVWKVCQYHLDVKKDLAWINRILELTIKSGSVTQLLFNNIRAFLPPQYLQKKLKTEKDVWGLTVHDLPPEWTCNVKIGKDRGRGNHNRKQ